jgi:protein-S-isoprenylcysteine O-methyltransferase Ste14
MNAASIVQVHLRSGCLTQVSERSGSWQRAAIALAERVRADLVLIDEADGRIEAARRRIMSMKIGIFLLSFSSGLAIVLLSLASVATKRFDFWPPPSSQSWQYRTIWTLFRILVAGVVILSVIDFNGSGTLSPAWRYYVGLPLAVLGLSLALYVTFYLGWKNAHGGKEGLTTGGFYKWSRNPVYVVSIVGFVGLGITINSACVYTLLGVWALMYVMAPFLEEPWLEEAYGGAYAAYKTRVPRFVGFLRRKT